jgi:predicted GNAT family N-acyltransferase
MAFVSRDRFDLDLSDIHSPSFPAEVRTHDGLVARVRLRDQNAEFQTVRVWRISPLGIELVRAEDNESILYKGSRIDLEIVVAGQFTSFEGLVVDVISENASISLAGIRLAQSKDDRVTTNEKRRSSRWLCSEDFYPTCVCSMPGRFNEYVYLQIRDISREGLKLYCSLRNKYLIPGTQLNLTASFPTIGDVALTVRIKRVGVTSERDKDYLVLGTEYVALGNNSRNVIGQYLLQFGDPESLSELRESGFVPPSISKGTDFYFLKTEADYEQVLKLRLLAHRAGNTVGCDAAYADMSDKFDSNSRIIVAKYKGGLVASARVHYGAIDEKMEHEQYVNWRSEYPRRDNIVEITRVCTHPDFRSNDLLAGLIRYLTVTCFQPQRPWVLLSSTSTMAPFYEKLGVKKMELQYQHPVYKGTQHVMLAYAPDVLSGKTVNPIYWNIVWKDVFDHLVAAGTLIPRPIDQVRVKIYRLLSPATAFLALRKKPRRPKSSPLK